MARRDTYSVALGGVLAALAVVIMTLGTMIPVATFVCPMMCMGILAMVDIRCGNRISWAWYGAVTVLSLLLSPDKEAAAVFTALGYYPIIKPKLDKLPLKWLWKLLYFNVVILALYWLLMHVFGVAQIIEEFAELGTIMTCVTLLLGNVSFVMIDRLLELRFRKKK